MSAADSPQRLEACLPVIFAGEGGYTANPKDPGNWSGGKVGSGKLIGTKYGIAASANPGVDIKNLTLAQAAEIYRRKYWTTAGCDQLDAGVDLPIFDASVNSGPGRGLSFNKATAAIRESVTRIKSISAKRRAFYQGLKTFKTFGKGWMSRVATVEAKAIKMALAAGGSSPVIIAKQLQAEASLSTKKVNNGTTGAGGVAAGGAVVPAAGFDWLQVGLAVGFVAIALVIAIHFIRAHQERAQAFQAEALQV